MLLMKKVFQHITSLFLALLVLVSTQSYSVNSHYCGNILVDKSFVKPAKKCAMHESKTHHHKEEEAGQCCADETQIIEGQDQLKIQSLEIELPHPYFVEAFFFNFILPTTFEEKETFTFYTPPPPLLQRDVQALYQVYLI